MGCDVAVTVYVFTNHDRNTDRFVYKSLLLVSNKITIHCLHFDTPHLIYKITSYFSLPSTVNSQPWVFTTSTHFTLKQKKLLVQTSNDIVVEQLGKKVLGLNWGLSMRASHIISMSVRAFSSFIPRFKHMHFKLIGDSKLHLSVSA